VQARRGRVKSAVDADGAGRELGGQRVPVGGLRDQATPFQLRRGWRFRLDVTASIFSALGPAGRGGSADLAPESTCSDS